MTKTEELALMILEDASILIGGGGRPRKLPGKNRFEATIGPYRPIDYRSPWAGTFSLAGAIKRAAYSNRGLAPKATMSRAKQLAAAALLNESWETIFPAQTIVRGMPAKDWDAALRRLDNDEPDTRAIQRLLAAARRRKMAAPRGS